MIQISSKAITGLKKLTIAHILRSVFRKTPCSCSSTKLAELSKPEIPNIGTENPKKRAFTTPPVERGRLQLILKISNPLLNINHEETTTKIVNVDKWIIKITTATIADSPIPKIASPVTASK